MMLFHFSVDYKSLLNVKWARHEYNDGWNLEGNGRGQY